MRDPHSLAVQYADDHNLRIRSETHRLYGVGPGLEESVDRVLRLAGSESLLDAGTGPGHYPGRLRSASHQGRLVGLDLSEGMLELARRTYPEVEFVLGDAVALPFAPASFDVLSARHMLYHVSDVNLALTEFQRVLKPGGRFLMVTNGNGFMAEFWEAVATATRGDPDFEGVRRELDAPLYWEEATEELVKATFGNARSEIVQSALEFPSPEPVLAYFDSARTMYGLSEASWARGRAGLARVLEPHFRHGSWRVSKRVQIVLATGPY